MKPRTLLSLILICLMAQPLLAQGRGGRPQPQATSPTYWSPYPPPKPLRLVRGHWTPYFPPDPDSFPPDSNIHTIAAGETLWTLAGQFYGDNLLWPFLWENNSYITDPHWIYPGDPLYVPPLVVISPDDLARVDEFEAPPIGEVFMPAGSITDMYCSFFILPYLDDKETTEWADYDTVVVGSDEPVRITHGDHDVLYINKGSAEGILPGQEFTVLRWDQRLEHPVYGEPLGEVIRMVGTARVLCTQEHSSTVLITSSCGAIEPGMRLVPWEERPSPMRAIEEDFQRHCVEENPYGRGHIVYLDYDQVDVATWDRVAIDLGTEHGILPGDRFTIYREVQQNPVRMKHETFGNVGLERYNERRRKLSWEQAEEIMNNAYPARKRGPFRTLKLLREIREEYKRPRIVLGELIVLAAADRTSTAIMATTVQEVFLGDQVELKSGQPVQ